MTKISFFCPVFLGHSKARGRCSQNERVLYGRDLCCSGGIDKAEAAKLPGVGIGPKQCPGKCEAEKGWPAELRRILEERCRRGVRVKGGLKTRAFSSRWC